MERLNSGKDSRQMEAIQMEITVQSVGGIDLIFCESVQSKHACSTSQKGGELITFTWLLMAHFGLGEQFQII